MSSGEAGAGRRADHCEKWLTTVASLAAGAAFLGLWAWLLPAWLGFQVDTTGVRPGGGLPRGRQRWVSQ